LPSSAQAERERLKKIEDLLITRNLPKEPVPIERYTAAPSSSSTASAPTQQHHHEHQHQQADRDWQQSYYEQQEAAAVAASIRDDSAESRQRDLHKAQEHALLVENLTTLNWCEVR
jgi:hypothetical protein